MLTIYNEIFCFAYEAVSVVSVVSLIFPVGWFGPTVFCNSQNMLFACELEPVKISFQLYG